MIRGFALVVLVTIWVTTGSFASAEEAPVRLGIEALESDQPYFDVTLEPGESRDLTVRFSNHGEDGTSVAVYSADVYTINGGGLGLRSIDEPRTGATEWIDFPGETMDLLPGEQVEHTFSVTVPEGTGPGDYITSIVMQNADPVAVGSDEDDEQFTQTVRYGIAVAIDVPGPREPWLEIGDVSHELVGNQSVVLFDVDNPGNTHLQPSGEFSLLSSEGDVMSEMPLALDSIYAGTDTSVEAFLGKQLEPGEYAASLVLTDETTGADTSVEQVSFSVPAPSAETDPGSDPETGGVVTGQNGSSETGGRIDYWLIGTFSALALLVSLAALLLLRRRSSARPGAVSDAQKPGRSAAPRPASIPMDREPQRSAPPLRVRQLLPDK